ncbi:PucR family transcriptional regulator [Streptomyces alkaliterrae]|uniref:Helix-turn-helix domain-containing protein n=1 Tax=Streptomyces alkaliterrae TaxID=2213162 RepID=A0A5P0YTX4_9ACTN|nr:helix-turn-helix domain-containing protein [Streptomyces alkaliterrae]MBB1261117.1 helix-turn-helix domain-containing protein [Streptomyces alkaliterrae]MQS03077.1 PucR family transcriptional regulator [Streptomyces alkaliterrae]
MSEDFQTLIDEVSALLGTPATLENRDFELIAFGAHESAGDDAELVMDPVRTRSIMQRRSTAAVRAWFERFGITRAAGPVRIPPDPAAGVVKGRICLPVRHGGVVYGYVWLLDDGSRPLEDPRLREAMATAARIGALLAGQARTGARLGGLLRAALAGPRQGREAATAELRAELGSAADAPMALLAVGPWRVEDPRAGNGRAAGGRRRAAVAEPGRAGGDSPAATPAAVPNVPVLTVLDAEEAGRQAPRGPALAALVRLRAAGSLEPAVAAAHRLLRAGPTGGPTGGGPTGGGPTGGGPTGGGPTGGGPTGGGPTGGGPTGGGERGPLCVGVSAPRSGLVELDAAWYEAQAALRAAHAERRLAPIATWPGLGPYRLLSALPAGVAVDPAVRRLLEPAHREMARTAEVFLDLAGQAGRTAAELGIHRQTLYYRLSRVEQLTGLDLADGESRLLLHMALKAARL